MKKCIIVAGMHRSGTSLITKSLECLGVSLGDRLMPSAQHNEKGFWEDLDIVDIDDRILKLADMDWASLNEFPMKLIDSEKGIKLQNEAKKIVLDRLNQNNLWGVKDPRITRLIPFWKKIFSDLGVQTSYIFVLRNPIDVSNSLKARDNFDLEMSLHLWLIHAFESLRHLIKENIYFVSYDNFLAEPERSIREISGSFKLELNEEKLLFLKNDFIDLKLRHSCSTDQELFDHKDIPAVVKNFYMVLKNLADSKIEKDSVKEIISDMENQYLATTASTVHKFSRNGQIFDIELNNVLKHHKNLINQHEMLHNYTIDLESKNESLLADKSKLQQKIIDLELQNTTFQIEKAEILETNKLLKNQINIIYESRSWKLTKPLRALKNFLSHQKPEINKVDL